MFNKILVPLDGSPIAERALGMARELAVQFDSEITLCRVASMSGYAVIRSPAFGANLPQNWSIVSYS